MDLAAAFLAAEELISSIPTQTEAGRIKAISIYNAASHLLDDAVGAWYKRVPTSERVMDADSEKPDWVKRLQLLTRIPWIAPVYAVSEGIDYRPNRTMQLFSAPDHFLKDPHIDWSDPNSMYSWRGGPPKRGLNCIGLAFSMYTLSLDEPRLDFLSSSSMRGVYGNARGSLLEMGAAHTRNIPYAGIIRSPNIPLCPIGMNRLGSDWTLNFQGALYTASPIQRWLAMKLHRYEIFKYSVILEPVPLAQWTTEAEAQEAVEAIFFQVATMRAWVYLQESLDLRSDPLPRMFPVTPVSRGYLPAMHRPPLTTHLATRKRAINRHDGTIGFLMHSLGKAIRAKKIKLPRRLQGVIKAIQVFMVDRAIQSKTLSDLAAVQSSAKYDPRRIQYLRRLASTLQMLASLNDRKRLLVKLRAELLFREHFYWDSESGVRVFCEHELAVLSDLSRGISNPEAIIEKYSSHVRAEGVMDLPITTPTVLECRYCGQDLGTIWLVSATTPEESEYIRRIEGTYLDNDIGSVIVKLMSSRSIQTRLLPTDIAHIVDQIVNIPLGAEFGKLGRSGAQHRSLKEQFLTLAATVSVVNALSQSGAPLNLDPIAMEALLSKDYIDLLQKIGLLPKTAIQRMLDYWPKTLARHLPNPRDTIKNAVLELSGAKDDALLARIYQSALISPIGMKEDKALSDIDPAKMALQSARDYVSELQRQGPIPPDQRKFYRIPRIGRTRRDARIYVPKNYSPAYRGSDIGKTEETDLEEVFRETVANLCPELLMRPVSGKDFYAAKQRVMGQSEKDAADLLSRGGSRAQARRRSGVGEEGDSHLTGIYASKVYLESHLFPPTSSPESEPKATCEWCGIPSDYDYGKGYFAKYRKAVVEELGNRTAGRVFDCKARAGKGSSPDAAKAQVHIDAALDKELHQKFSHRFDWFLGPDPAIVPELALIVSAIGHYRLGRMVTAAIQSRADGESGRGPKAADLIITAWNLFMAWMLKQTDALSVRTLNRLKAIRALSSAAA